MRDTSFKNDTHVNINYKEGSKENGKEVTYMWRFDINVVSQHTDNHTHSHTQAHYPTTTGL